MIKAREFLPLIILSAMSIATSLHGAYDQRAAVREQTKQDLAKINANNLKHRREFSRRPLKPNYPAQIESSKVKVIKPHEVGTNSIRTSQFIKPDQNQIPLPGQIPAQQPAQQIEEEALAGMLRAHNNNNIPDISAHSEYREEDDSSSSQSVDPESIRKNAHKNALEKLEKKERKTAPIVQLKKKFKKRLASAPDIIAQEAKAVNETPEEFIKKMFIIEYQKMIKRHPDLLQQEADEEPIKSVEQLWQEVLKSAEKSKSMKGCYACFKACSIQ
jgi:hypothetical protein